VWTRRCGRTLKDALVSTKTAACFCHLAEKSCCRRECSVPGGQAISRLQAARFTFPGFVTVGSVVETDLTVVFVRAWCLPATAPLATWGAELSPLVVGRELSAVVAGKGAYGCLVLSVDGGVGAAGPAAV
jgi:hypothetical protein